MFCAVLIILYLNAVLGLALLASGGFYQSVSQACVDASFYALSSATISRFYLPQTKLECPLPAMAFKL